jgi:hypothetical protein
MATIAVISFAVLAGGSQRFGFFENRISPVDASTTTAARELIVSAKEFERGRWEMNMKKAKQHQTLFRCRPFKPPYSKCLRIRACISAAPFIGLFFWLKMRQGFESPN